MTVAGDALRRRVLREVRHFARPARVAADLRAPSDARGAEFAVRSGGPAVQDPARLLLFGSPRLVAVDTLPVDGMSLTVIRSASR